MIGLISCSAIKLAHRAPARELYSSSLFSMSLAYAEARCSRVFVLSALHMLVPLDEVLAPYNLKMSNLGKREREQWANRVLAKLTSQCSIDTDVMMLAGADYTVPLSTAMRTMHGFRDGAWRGWRGAITEPLAGLQIGQRLAFLSRANRATSET